MTTRNVPVDPYVCGACFRDAMHRRPLSIYAVCSSCGAMLVEDAHGIAMYDAAAVREIVEMGFGGRC